MLVPSESPVLRGLQNIIPVGPDRIGRRLEKELVFEINRRKLVFLRVMEARRFRLRQ